MLRRLDIAGVLWLSPVAAMAIALGLIAGVDPPAALVVSLGIGYVLLSFSNLAAGFAVFVFIGFLEVLTIGGVASASAGKVVGALLALSWLAAMIQGQRDGKKPRDIFRVHPAYCGLLLVFLGWALLSITWAEQPSAGAVNASRYAINLAIFPVAFTALSRERHVGWVLWAFVLGALASVAYGLFGPVQDSDDIGRLSGAGVNANDLAVLLVGGGVFAAAIAATASRPHLRLGATMAGVLCLVALLLTQSRAGLVALAVALFASLLIAKRRRGAVVAAGLVAVALVVGYLGAVASPQAQDRLTAELATGTGRTDLWTLGLRVVEDRPILGAGIGNFGATSQLYVLEPGALESRNIITKADEPRVAHNIYLETFAELGVIGFALFAMLLAWPLAITLRAARSFLRQGNLRMEILTRALFAAQAAALTAGFFASLEYNKQLWLVLALGPVMAAFADANGGVQRQPTPSSAYTPRVPLTIASSVKRSW